MTKLIISRRLGPLTGPRLDGTDAASLETQGHQLADTMAQFQLAANERSRPVSA